MLAAVDLRFVISLLTDQVFLNVLIFLMKLSVSLSSKISLIS